MTENRLAVPVPRKSPALTPMKIRRNPPYSCRLGFNERASKAVRVFVGSRSWEQAESAIQDLWNVLCLPPGEDPAMYRWPVQGRSVVIYDAGAREDELTRLAACCFRSGATVIAIVEREGSVAIIPAREPHNGT